MLLNRINILFIDIRRTLIHYLISIMALIDTHCHLDLDRFTPFLDDIVKQARKENVAQMIIPGVTRSSWQRIQSLCKKYQGLYAAPGLHPLYLQYHQPDDLIELKNLSQDSIVAIGEIGLDYYYQNSDKDKQQDLFEQQVLIAQNAQLPIILHVRKAHDQVLSTLRKKQFQHGGIIHAFNGSLQQAHQYIQLGFCIGICGTITYGRARKIRKVAAAIPLDSLVLETDSPDIPVSTAEGSYNLPHYLPIILSSLASIRSEQEETLAKATTDNAKRVLRL